MSLLVWNCRGLGNPLTEDQLATLVWAKDPSVVFIAETWIDKARLEQVKRRIQFKNLFEVPRRNKEGDTTINKNRPDEWRFTGFYGELDTHKRHESWTKLRDLKSKKTSPWLCAGDFNEITLQLEKVGGRPRPHSQMQPFRDVLDDCNFIDLGYVGFPYTWHKHFEDYTIFERLDRGLATADWFTMFPGTKIHHLDVTTSDHKPLWITPEGMDSNFHKPFRFKQMWLTDEGCTDTVQAVWRERVADPWDTRILNKLDKCGRALTKWSKQCFGSVRRELETKNKLLQRAEKEAARTGNSTRMKLLEREINQLLVKKSMMWG
ncbi:uncharacterized protein LOC142616949 [Castanea sativa]|uniref:uncharacterized protein LOC142616949 n=1 Tax=Castanea sativa TaxID=21020 RepID=UPI003F6535A8